MASEPFKIEYVTGSTLSAPTVIVPGEIPGMRLPPAFTVPGRRMSKCR